MLDACDSASPSCQRLLDELGLPPRFGVREREPVEPNFGGRSQLEPTAARRSTRTVGSSGTTAPSPAPSLGRVETLERLAALRDSGAITNDDSKDEKRT